jgi:hypothetical protein
MGIGGRIFWSIILHILNLVFFMDYPDLAGMAYFAAIAYAVVCTFFCVLWVLEAKWKGSR